jgi:hypothetical protein
MKNGMIALVFAAFQAVSQGCLAAAAPVLNVPLLVSKADLIVVARLQPSQTKAEILDVIKGSPRGGEIKLRTFLQSEYGGTDTKTAILFLLQQGGENYRLLDSRGNFWSVSPTPIHVASQPDGPLAKVTAYLVGTLAVPSQILADPAEGVASPGMAVGTSAAVRDAGDETMHAATSVEQAEIIYADKLGELATIPSEIKHEMLESAVNGNANDMSQLYVQAALLDAGDTSHLTKMLVSLLNPDPKTPLAYAAIGQAIERAKMPADMQPVLLRLLSSPDVFIRRAGAYRLRQHQFGPATFPSSRKALERALLDPDQDVREFAASGLCWDLKLCTGEAAISRYRQRANAPQLLHMVAAWTERDKGRQ